MLTFGREIRVHLAARPVDFRKGIDGMAQSCREILHEDPFCGTVFVFRNRRATSLKVLVYDGRGFWLCQKRLSKGRLQWWPQADAPGLTLEAHELVVLLNGGDPEGARASPVWRPVKKAA